MKRRIKSRRVRKRIVNRVATASARLEKAMKKHERTRASIFDVPEVKRALVNYNKALRTSIFKHEKH